MDLPIDQCANGVQAAIVEAIVQAEIDCVSGGGFWFDCMEFSLEGA